ncbi:hypothetical protein JOC36_001234 [Weissella uvarum]|uniref:DUF6681 family protein n=1 Tax=Weissella uvarum TaxID=1479233 RepID=UPI001961BC7C|nr:DUF6681 family protein [Weissella uvarum]MBM7617672.1 hypothetical protein [Weissella uvarum]MCM0596021.1 hypothetical protein [Weissella uvarum]
MLSMLDLINHYMGYLNVNSKFKGRVYTLLALVGDAYILYLAFSYFKNHAYVRGALLCLAFLGILYFAVINFYYYFTQREPKWDVSPYIAKVLGAEEQKQETQQAGDNVQFVPANGLYNNEDVLPATVVLDPGKQVDLSQIADTLVQTHLADNNYGGLSDAEQMAQLENGQTKLYADGDGMPLPYYKLQQDQDGLAVYGGVNEMSAERLGLITKVGLQPIHEALRHYDLFIATATIQGGPAHVKGRSGLTTVQDPYDLQVTLAYQAK